jgi:hypothetical protein
MQTDELERVLRAVQDNQTANMGDADGSLWARTANVGMALHMPYGRLLVALSELHGEGRVQRHPTGADYWRVSPAGGRGAS